MTWQEVLDDKSLADLPYKIELDKEGCIVMSPATNLHARYQGRIGGRLFRMIPDGDVLTECSVDTPDNVKCPDVAWASKRFLKKYGNQTPYQVAPELCVEVVSPSNSSASIERKRYLYLLKGALEVWICDREGGMKFFNDSGEISKSKLFPKFPATIKLL